MHVHVDVLIVQVIMTSVDLCDLRTFLWPNKLLGVDECVGNQQPIKCPQLCASLPALLPIKAYPGQRYTEAILVRVGHITPWLLP